MTILKNNKQLMAILNECETVTDLNKATRKIYKELDEAYITRETVKFLAHGRKHQILMGNKA